VRRVTARMRRRAGAVALVAALLATLSLSTSAPVHAGEDPGAAWQEPFLCTTEYHGLGQPIVDNDQRRGTPVYPEDDIGTPDRTQDPLGWSEGCQAETLTTYHYRDTAGDLHDVLADATDLPADVAMLGVEDLVGADDMQLAGATEIPYVLRLERGTLPEQRFMYAIAMLAPWEEAAGAEGTSRDHWNGRLLYSFDGGVAIGHSQGSLSLSSATFDDAVQLGHAVVYSSGTATTVHYNLLRGGLAAMETKSRFVAEHGEPLYTVGIGGSGGGIQQYVYGQNQPDLLDAAIPLYSYPDMTTQTIHTGDCELLEHYMDVTDAENPRWRDWDERRIVEGLNSIDGFTSSWQERTGAGGSTECVEGWRGLTPLAMNPRFGFSVGLDDALMAYLPELLGKLGRGEAPVPDDFPDIGRLIRVSDDPADWVEWTHWNDAREVYGTDPETGLARVPWDNVGVQYGLRPVADGRLTPEEFLDLNARVGTWRGPEDAAAESCGLVEQMLGSELTTLARAIGACEGDELDQHSARQMDLGDSLDVPAPRREGDVEAIRGAFEHDLVFGGEMGRVIPIIDARHYLEHELDMHNAHQSFSVRERIARAQGHHDNHLVWFLDARPEADEDATHRLLRDGFRVVDEWMADLAADPTGDVVAARPAAAVDTCFDTTGEVIATGDDVWDGAVDLIETGAGDWTGDAPTEIRGVTVGPCARHFPLHSTSRIVAGGPVTGEVYKCHTMPVRTAVAEGLYGEWSPGADDVAQLEAIHPSGVCDYGLPSVGHPDAEVAAAPEAAVDGATLRISGADPGAAIEVRHGGEVVDEATADGSGAAQVEVLESGDHVVSQVVDGQRSLLSPPVAIDGVQRASSDASSTSLPVLAVVAVGLAVGLAAGLGTWAWRRRSNAV
jgi:hypothetical protein